MAAGTIDNPFAIPSLTPDIAQPMLDAVPMDLFPQQQQQANAPISPLAQGQQLGLMGPRQAPAAPPGSAEWQRHTQSAIEERSLNRQMQIQDAIQKELGSAGLKPWSELGTGGKIGRVAGIAGDIIAPSIAQRIPGTPLYDQQRLAILQSEADKQQELATGQLSAQARMIEAQTAKHGQLVQMRIGNQIVLGHMDPTTQDLVPYRDEQGNYIEAGLPRQFTPVNQQVTPDGKPVSFEPSTNQYYVDGKPYSGPVVPLKGPAEQAKEMEIQAYMHNPDNAKSLGLAPGETFETLPPERQAHVRDLTDQAVAKFAPGPYVALTGQPGQPGILYNPVHGTKRPLPPGYQTPQQATFDAKQYTENQNEIEKLRQPVAALNTRFGTLQTSIAQGNMLTDSMLAPEILSTVAGGAGSGLRMTDAEINRIVGGRSNWENLRAKLQAWNTDPKRARSITPEQEREIKALVGAMQTKVQAKLTMFQQADDAMNAATDSSQYRIIRAGLQKDIENIDNGRFLTQGQIDATVTKTGRSREDVLANAAKQKYTVIP